MAHGRGRGMIASSLSWAALWLLWLLLLGLVAFPLTYRVLPGLPSRGVAVSPAFGLLLASYLSWLLASVHLLRFGRSSLFVACGCILAASVVSEVASQWGATRWLRHHAGIVIAYALVLIAVFALFVWIRGYYPDVRSTEKPMEIGLLTSTMRAEWMPPHDAWLSGFGINYYYFGYVEAATLGLLANVRPEVAFNLMSASLPALTFVGASGIAFDVLARWRRERRMRTRHVGIAASLVGGALVAIAGNAYGFAQFLVAPSAVLHANFWSGIGWRSSRVVHDMIIPGKSLELITEFPMFSFILGDIHPHVLALPTVTLVIAVALSFWYRPASLSWGTVAQFGCVALAIGALYPINAWDLPTYALLVGAAMIVRRPHYWRRSALTFVGVIAGAVILFLPYYLHFTSLVGGHGDEPALIQELARYPILHTVIGMFGIVIWPHTDIRQFLAVFALPLVAAGALVLRGNISRRDRLTSSTQRAVFATALGVAIVALVTRTAMLLPTGIVGIAGVLAVTRPIAGRRGESSAWSVWTATDRAMSAVVVVGAVLPVITEFVFLRDAFDNRMNTMFKVDYQAWILLLIAGAYGIVTFWWTLRAAKSVTMPSAFRWESVATRVGLTVFVLFAAIYPLLVPFQKSGHFGAEGLDYGGPGMGWQGMDGFHYLTESNPNEFAAAMWLRDHAGPNDRLIEALGNSYGDANGWFDSRFSASTGVPGVLGWYFHEVQWRGGSEQILTRDLPQRATDIGTFYRTTNLAEARQILAKYGINWVIVGDAEQDGAGRCTISSGCPPYPAAGLVKFNDMLDLAFRQGNVSIYHVR